MLLTPKHSHIPPLLPTITFITYISMAPCPEGNLGISKKHDLREAMLRVAPGSTGLLLEAGVFEIVVLSSTEAEAVEKTERSPADFVGEAKRLSGRMCSKLSWRSKSAGLELSSVLLLPLSLPLLLLQDIFTSCLSGLSAAAVGEVVAAGLLLFSSGTS